MKLYLGELKEHSLQAVVIESVDLSVYIAFARFDDKEQVIFDSRGKLLKTKNLLDMQKKIYREVNCNLFLRQRSAYDEMIGFTDVSANNTMELFLANQPLPLWLD